MRDVELIVKKRSLKGMSIGYIFSLLVLLCLSGQLNAACDPNILNVDFGLTGQTPDACWSSWAISGAAVIDASDPNHLISIGSPLGQSGTVGVRVDWTGGGSGVGVRERTLTHSQHELLHDHLYNDGGSMAIRLFDLIPGTYFITTYHADPGNKRNPIDITVEDGAGVITPIDEEGADSCDTGRVISGVQQSLGTTATDGVSSITFAFIVSGKESEGILIGFADAGGPDLAGPVLNGFTLVRPVQHLIQVDTGTDTGPGPFENYEIMSTSDANGLSVSISVDSIHGVSGSVGLSLSEAGYVWRVSPSDFIEVGDPYRSLLNDMCYSMSEMTLTISGLKAGTYQVSSYHNDPDSSQRNMDIYVDGYLVVDEAEQSSAILTKTTCYSKILVPFTVENDGDAVLVNYKNGEYGGGGIYIILNGFEINLWQIPDQVVCGHPSVPPLSGDFNGDCSVDIDDAKVLASQWLGSSLP